MTTFSISAPGVSAPSVSASDNASPVAATKETVYYGYGVAADPITSGATPRIPYHDFHSDLYAAPGSRIVPLDLSAALKCSGPATSPGLLANYVKIEAGDEIETASGGTSELFYVIRGNGYTHTSGETIAYNTGDILTLPGSNAIHCAKEETVFYWVHDAPLLRYLGAERAEPRFSPAIYPAARLAEELRAIEANPASATWSRKSILLGNKNFEQTMTITHVLWAMFGVVSSGTRQLPHRHQSVALDFIVKADPGAYTLVGTELDDAGQIKDPVRVDWATGSTFVTPPGYWHEHRNESGQPAYVMPIQDAGLHTYLRTLDIQFYRED
jgi:gentisate 1,2-dioxygenase